GPLPPAQWTARGSSGFAFSFFSFLYLSGEPALQDTEGLDPPGLIRLEGQGLLQQDDSILTLPETCLEERQRVQRVGIGRPSFEGPCCRERPGTVPPPESEETERP